MTAVNRQNDDGRHRDSADHDIIHIFEVLEGGVSRKLTQVLSKFRKLRIFGVFLLYQRHKVYHYCEANTYTHGITPKIARSACVECLENDADRIERKTQNDER